MGIFTACIIPSIALQDGKVKVKIRNATNLIIANPTEEDKEEDESWLLFDPTRSAEDSQEEASGQLPSKTPFPLHTKPYSFKAQEKLIPKSDRAASEEVSVTSYQVGDTHLFSDSETMYKQFTGTLKYEGDYCYIWLLDEENTATLMTQEEIEDFAQKFDSIYEKETTICGPKFQGTSYYSNIINPNEKISILFFDICHDNSDGDILGYFDPNMYILDDDLEENENQLELLCIDSYYAKSEDYITEVYSTLVHEFNHMLNYVNKTLSDGLYIETWYTEMLSMLQEDIFTEELNISEDNQIYMRLIPFMERGYVFGFKNWPEGFTSQDILYYCYANSYAFGAYLARNYGGPELIHQICTNDYVNEDSIVNAVNTINDTNYTFDDLLLNFAYILLNPLAEDEEMPSLYKRQTAEVGEFDYELVPINLNNISSDFQISPLTLKAYERKYFGAYGFHYYKFDKAASYNIYMKDFLVYDYN